MKKIISDAAEPQNSSAFRYVFVKPTQRTVIVESPVATDPEKASGMSACLLCWAEGNWYSLKSTVPYIPLRTNRYSSNVAH